MRTTFLLAAVLTTFGVLPAARAGVAINDCGWLEFLTIPGVSNAPDNVHTRIYQAIYSASAGHETVLRGHAPKARFWSFAVIDLTTAEIDNISDFEVAADVNGDYEIVIRPDCGAAPNCLSVGASQATLAGRLFHRLYLPEIDERGGVPLPAIEYRAGGDTSEPIVVPLDGEACATTELALERPLRADGQVGDLMNRPSGLDRPVPSPGPAPVVRRYDGVAGGQFENLENQLSSLGAPPEVIAAIEETRKHVGGGATADNGYVTVVFNMTMGNLRLHAKAPTYRFQHADARNGLGVHDGSEQTRYWSLCTTQEARPVDCLHDEEVVLDPDGEFFTMIVAPSCPVAGYVNCLRSGALSFAGGAAIDTLIYRNLLAGPSFANDQGPKVCPPGESEFCGDYALEAFYLARP